MGTIWIIDKVSYLVPAALFLRCFQAELAIVHRESNGFFDIYYNLLHFQHSTINHKKIYPSITWYSFNSIFFPYGFNSSLHVRILLELLCLSWAGVLLFLFEIYNYNVKILGNPTRTRHAGIKIEVDVILVSAGSGMHSPSEM